MLLTHLKKRPSTQPATILTHTPSRPSRPSRHVVARAASMQKMIVISTSRHLAGGKNTKTNTLPTRQRGAHRVEPDGWAASVRGGVICSCSLPDMARRIAVGTTQKEEKEKKEEEKRSRKRERNTMGGRKKKAPRDSNLKHGGKSKVAQPTETADSNYRICHWC